MRKPLRVTFYILATVTGLAVLGWVALVLYANHAAPALRAKLIRDLDRTYGGQTSLDPLEIKVFPRLGVSGSNLAIRLPDQAVPFLSIRHFTVEANLLELLLHPVHIRVARLDGLRINVPPHGQRGALHSAGHSGKGRAVPLFVIDEVICRDTNLQILTDKPGKDPLEFDIYSVTLHSAGPGQAMPFQARLSNPKPIGFIETHGKFGPWNTETLRETPVSGDYSFDHADLSSIDGIGGILSSKGRFQGVLGRIEVEGETDTPDFEISTGGHPLPLHTEFSATVDGTSGDTFLHPVHATLLHTELLASGSVVRPQDGQGHGHDIQLDVTADQAVIQDLLRLSLKTNPPAMTGPIRFRTRFLLPHGERPVPNRLQLEGSFTLPSARFTSRETVSKLDQLSLRASGHPKAAQQAKDEATPPPIASKMSGRFKLKAGNLALSQLHFEIPGAAIALAGDYHIDDRQFSFAGQVRLAARLSQMTTGVKSFLLKAVDPFFAKQGAGTVLPVRITGTGTSPHFTLDFHRSHTK